MLEEKYAYKINKLTRFSERILMTCAGRWVIEPWDWKNNSDQMSERPASLGIMDAVIEAPLSPKETPRISQHSIAFRALRGALKWIPIMPRDASLSDSPCEDFQSGYMCLEKLFLNLVNLNRI